MPKTAKALLNFSATIEDGRIRAVIDAVFPNVDGGRFAVKRVAGEPVAVSAHCFTDGHDVLRVMLCWRKEEQTELHEILMQAMGNDVWSAEFTPPAMGRYRYSVIAWVDPFESWRVKPRAKLSRLEVETASNSFHLGM